MKSTLGAFPPRVIHSLFEAGWQPCGTLEIGGPDPIVPAHPYSLVFFERERPSDPCSKLLSLFSQCFCPASESQMSCCHEYGGGIYTRYYNFTDIGASTPTRDSVGLAKWQFEKYFQPEEASTKKSECWPVPPHETRAFAIPMNQLHYGPGYLPNCNFFGLSLLTATDEELRKVRPHASALSTQYILAPVVQIVNKPNDPESGDSDCDPSLEDN